MKLSIFNFLQVLSFTTPVGCALLTGLKQGLLSGFVGLIIGMAIGISTFCCVTAAVRFGGQRALRLESEARRETALGSLFVTALALLIVATFGAMRVTDQVIVVLTRPVP